jgi:EAL domain-containing protein (putative c-di-GMP-specific phosphodiesterase class I)
MLGCDLGQGYHFARPAPPAAIEPLLATAVPVAV